jgi:hypothetical protein
VSRASIAFQAVKCHPPLLARGMASHAHRQDLFFDAQNVLTVPHARLIRKLGNLPQDQFALVELAVRGWLGL